MGKMSKVPEDMYLVTKIVCLPLRGISFSEEGLYPRSAQLATESTDRIGGDISIAYSNVIDQLTEQVDAPFVVHPLVDSVPAYARTLIANLIR
jgi:hypothetical protein